MKAQKLVALILLIPTLYAFPAEAAEQDASSQSPVFTESDALQMAQKWAACVSEGNIAALEKLLDEKYVHIHSTALIESRAQFIDALKSGSRKYDVIKLEDVNVRVFGGTAVVTGKFNLKVFARGKTIEGINRFGLVLAQTPDGWRVVSYQATPIPKPN